MSLALRFRETVDERKRMSQKQAFDDNANLPPGVFYVLPHELDSNFVKLWFPYNKDFIEAMKEEIPYETEEGVILREWDKERKEWTIHPSILQDIIDLADDYFESVNVIEIKNSSSKDITKKILESLPEQITFAIQEIDSGEFVAYPSKYVGASYSLLGQIATDKSETYAGGDRTRKIFTFECDNEIFRILTEKHICPKLSEIEPLAITEYEGYHHIMHKNRLMIAFPLDRISQRAVPSGQLYYFHNDVPYLVVDLEKMLEWYMMPHDFTRPDKGWSGVGIFVRNYGRSEGIAFDLNQFAQKNMEAFSKFGIEDWLKERISSYMSGITPLETRPSIIYLLEDRNWVRTIETTCGIDHDTMYQVYYRQLRILKGLIDGTSREKLVEWLIDTAHGKSIERLVRQSNIEPKKGRAKTQVKKEILADPGSIASIYRDWKNRNSDFWEARFNTLRTQLPWLHEVECITESHSLSSDHASIVIYGLGQLSEGWQSLYPSVEVERNITSSEAYERMIGPLMFISTKWGGKELGGVSVLSKDEALMFRLHFTVDSLDFIIGDEEDKHSTSIRINFEDAEGNSIWTPFGLRLRDTCCLEIEGHYLIDLVPVADDDS